MAPDVFISDRLDLEGYVTAIDQFKRGVDRKIQVRPGTWCTA